MSIETTSPRDELASLYPTLAPELSRFAVRFGLARTEAEDVVSESFAALLSLREERLAQIENLRAYLFTVVRNLASRAAQHRGLTVPVPDDELDQVVFGEDYLVLAEDHALARVAFAGLTQAQQNILWATLVDRLPAREVAEKLGISPSNVTTQALRARATLRESYITAFLRDRPPTCGTAPSLIARVVLGTSPARAQRRFNEHAIGCDECKSLLEQGRTQASSRALLGVVALGGVAAGRLGGGAGASTSAASEKTTISEASIGRRRSGRRRLLLSAGLLLLLALLATASVSGIAGHLKAAREMPALVPLPVVGIDASPAQITLDMPAPGKSARWAVTLTSSSNVTTSVVLATVGEISVRSPEQPLFDLGRDGAEIVGPTPLGSLKGVTYLGEIRAGETLTFDGTLTRSMTDTNQRLGGRTDLRFSAGVGLGEGAEPGDILDATQWRDSPLAQTGISTIATIAAVIILLSAGTVLIWHPWPRAASVQLRHSNRGKHIQS